nr:MAG TPA: hypothetical protein [Bacteriophage sp.]
MAKPTQIKDDQTLIYQLGQDMAKLELDIEKLKNKSIKAFLIKIPAKPENYQAYSIQATIDLPPECQNAICIKSENDNVSLIKTNKTLLVYTEQSEYSFYLAPIYRLEAETINALISQEQINDVEERERQERQERERQERQERERQERERQEREERVYKYLAKWLTDNYLEGIRVKAANSEFERVGIKVYVNKNGLTALLNKPFERNSYLSNTILNESSYTDAKSAMLAEKARIDRGEVDLSVASDFKVVGYEYINDIL